MSRSGYGDGDDCDSWATIRYMGALAAAKRGKRGQAFLKELLTALDAMPRKRLITNFLKVDGDQDSYTGNVFYDGVHLPDLIVGADELVAKNGTVSAMGEVCALGALGEVRGLDMSGIDPEDADSVAAAFGINEKIAREIVYMNDECFDFEWVDGKKGPDGVWIDGYRRPITPEERWQKMRDWIAAQIWEWKEIDESPQSLPTDGEAG